MRIIKDSLNELKLIEAPRPHYLSGESKIYNENGEGRLITKVVFPSSVPSIGDRLNAPTPHVNISDAYFSLWNAIHLLGKEIGFYDTLSPKGNYKVIKPLLGDTKIQLEATVKNILPSQKIENYNLEAEFMGKFSVNEKLYLVLKGKGIGRSR